MKKILIFIYSLGAGGAERVVCNLSNFLSRNYEIHIVLMNKNIFYDIDEKIKIHYLENSSINENPLFKFLKLFSLAFKFKKIVNKIDPDLIFSLMNRPCYISCLARLLGLKKPLLISERSLPSMIYKENNLKSKINKILIKFLYPKSDLIIANSMSNFNDLIDNFAIKKNKLKLIYNPLDINKINHMACEKINFKDQYFLNIGRLDDGKNQKFLIKTFSKIKTDKKLLIIGDGDLGGELGIFIRELGLENKVFLLGFKKNPYKYIKNSFCFVSCSKFEGFSNVLLEALACGKFIISSNHLSAREILGDDEYGVLFSLNDENSLKNIIEKYLNDENLVKDYELKARIRALDFEIEKISFEFKEVFDEFLQV